MIEMFTKETPMPGFEWIQVTEFHFQEYLDKYCLVRQNNGKTRKYYDCDCDAITAIAELHGFDGGSDMMYYVQREKKEKKK